MKNIFSVLFFPIYLYLQNGGPFNIMWRRNGIPLKDNLSWISQKFKLSSYLSLEWSLIVLSYASLRRRNISDYSRGRWSKIIFLRRGKSENLAKRNEKILKERADEKKMTKTPGCRGDDRMTVMGKKSENVFAGRIAHCALGGLAAWFLTPFPAELVPVSVVNAQSWAGLRCG